MSSESSVNSMRSADLNDLDCKRAPVGICELRWPLIAYRSRLGSSVGLRVLLHRAHDSTFYSGRDPESRPLSKRMFA